VAKHNWICAEDTTVVEGDEQQGQALFKQFPRFETISRTIMEQAFTEQKEALASYYTDSPESLSRIRKRIASELD